MNTIEVEISYGKLKGIREKDVSIFKGVPYAGSVSGDRRFRRPAPLEPWTGVRDTTQLDAPAIQPGPRFNEPDPAEDCLFLNIWTPAADDQKRPVMFYNHGGGFVIGSGGAPQQDGANLARNFDVVVVQTNHRLGLLGFLYLEHLAGSDYHGSGNQGLLDITQALKWVHENISVFGGDPNNVMIFGESGGGAKTSCLYAMPEAAPYFNKASVESGPGVRMNSIETAMKTTELVLKELNIAPEDWQKLLDVPAEELLKIQSKIPFVPPFQRKEENAEEPTANGFGPVVDGDTLPIHPFDPTAPEISRDKPLMVGWNEDEFMFFLWERKDTSVFSLDFFSLQTRLEEQFGPDAKQIIATYRKTMPKASAAELFIAISSIAMMGLGSIEIAEKKAVQADAPVYLYNFGYKSETPIPGTDVPMGTPHAMDITFKTPGNGPGFFSGNRPERFVASHKMAELWANFARTGKPSAADVPDWPAYQLDTRPMMRIDADCEVIYDRFRDELEMWRSVGFLTTTPKS